MPRLELFPRPRSIEWFSSGAVHVGAVREHHDRTLAPQGYIVTIDAQRARLDYADEPGRRYGRATIDQLAAAGPLPSPLRIVDWPDFSVRGYMLDVSRDRVPTWATLQHLVTRLATWRYNQLQLYIEHTFAHPGHDVVWQDASPITADDLTRLDALCAQSGIELVVNQNTFGHFGRWLAHDEYRARAECPDGIEIAPGISLPPTVLAPTPANAAFALQLVHNQLDCVTSRCVNIGCDETFELGRGASAARVHEEGLATVYTHHLQRLVNPLVDDGYHVQFWGDVARSHPDVLDHLPPHGCVPLVWNYDAPDVATPTLASELTAVLAKLGIDLSAPTDFATITRPFVASERPFWVAPGTSTWQSLVGRLHNARANLLDAAIAGKNGGAEGYLVTDWGDSGHLNPPSISLAPIALGGAFGWCADANRHVDVAQAVNTMLVDDAANIFGGVLETIGGVAEETGIITRNASPLFQALTPSPADLASGSADPDRLASIIDQLEAADRDLSIAELGCVDAPSLVDETQVAIRLAVHAARRMRGRATGTRRDRTTAAMELTTLIEHYRGAWLETSRPGGLDDSVAGMERTLRRYQSAS